MSWVRPLGGGEVRETGRVSVARSREEKLYRSFRKQVRRYGNNICPKNILFPGDFQNIPLPKKKRFRLRQGFGLAPLSDDFPQRLICQKCNGIPECYG